MEGAFVSAATGALIPVLGKLSELMQKDFKLRKEIGSMEKELKFIHAFLVNMSEVEDVDAQDKLWMREVRELSYDIEDNIDEFMLRANGASATKSKGITGFMKMITNLWSKAKSRHQIAERIHELSAQVTEISERRQRYKMDKNSMDSSVSVDPRVCSLYKDVSELVGIDEQKNELINILMEKSASAQQLKVISIAGCGGLGKTTLANQVYRTVGQQFECRAFISVSQNPDVMLILRSILSQVKNQDYASTEAADVTQLINQILCFLENKRYLIVVDDVWTVQTWHIIRCAFSRSKCGSRIITTTRINEVAESCRSSYGGLVYKLQPLTSVDSKSLFFSRIFGLEGQCPPQFSDVSIKILKKCGGLPLAIITISGLLANKIHEDQWDHVESLIGPTIERSTDIDGMMRILSLSYFDLPHHLKTCLLYLSLFPEDYSINKKRLVGRWIAEGFIQEQRGYTLYELGERCFNELINRSLIEPWKTKKYGEVETCRVHDMILKFIISKSVEENFATMCSHPTTTGGQEINKIRRVSLEGNSLVPSSARLHHTRSLAVFSHSIELPPLQELRLLRVLDLEGCHQLQGLHLARIAELSLLKYVSFRATKLTKIPEQLAQLRCLETLDLRHNSVSELPASIVQLGRLARLYIDRMVKVPDGIGGMQALEELKHIAEKYQSRKLVVEIGELSNLRKLILHVESSLDDHADGSYKEYMGSMVSSLCRLGASSLRSLHLLVGYRCDSSFLMEQWHPIPTELRTLIIRPFTISSVPRWIGSLVNLQELELFVRVVTEDDLKILGGIPNLLHLELVAEEACRSTDGRPVRINGSLGFPFLKHLIIGESMCAFGFMFDAGAMPRLQVLELEFDAGLTHGLLHIADPLSDVDFDVGVNHLVSLATLRCSICYTGDCVPQGNKADSTMQRAVSAHPNHPRLIMRTVRTIRRKLSGRPELYRKFQTKIECGKRN